MKKQKRQFMILLALVVLICAAYAGVKFYDQRQQEKEKKQEDVAEREHFSDELEEPETPVRKEEKNIRKDSAKEEDDIEIIDLNDL